MEILKIKDYTKKKLDEHIILICSCIYLQFQIFSWVFPPIALKTIEINLIFIGVYVNFISEEAVNVTIGGVRTFEEGETTNISCKATGSRYLPSSLSVSFFSPKLTPILYKIFSNTSLHTRTEKFDNVTGTYTVVQTIPPILVEGYMNQGNVHCGTFFNGSFYQQSKQIIVFCKHLFRILPYLKFEREKKKEKERQKW